MEEILRSDIDMVVLPSIATESCPMTIIESICAGIPVITTNIGGQYELLADGGGVTVSPRSPDEITQAILKINENYKDYAAVAKKTGKKYSIGKFQENIRNLFEND
jgi:glycosyltransferase involved in cell wall biosynthesis